MPGILQSQNPVPSSGVGWSAIFVRSLFISLLAAACFCQAEEHGHAPAPESVHGRPKGTVVCGVLRLAEEWTEAGSPYWITGDVFVPVTSRLRVEAGVEIRVSAKPQPCQAEGHAAVEDHGVARDGHAGDKGHAAAATPGGHHGKEGSESAEKESEDPNAPPKPMDFSDSTYTTLTLAGAFYCIGSPDKPVRFLPADTGRDAPPWDGIRLLGQRQGRAEIAFTEIRGASVGVYATRSDFFIHHSVFEDNNTGLWAHWRGDVSVVNCVFSRNRSTGMLIDGGSPHVVNTLFWKNRSYGIWSDGRKTMTLEYNAFFDNGEDDCYRCPHTVLPLGEDARPDTLDAHGNRHADPLFIGSQSFIAARASDPRYDTPEHLIKDKDLAEAEKKTRWKWWGKKESETAFTPRGHGPFVLSEYSTLREAGHPARQLRNTDGSRSDIGLWGGPQERITKNPFPGY